MIPESYIRDWKEHAPWPDWAQVEQDMMICRGIIEIFRHPLLSHALVFRGGTALHKLFFHPPRRYSEDIDLVQLEAGPIGPIFDALHEVMTPWLGNPQRKQGPGVVNLTYRVESEIAPVKPLRLKVEINAREHFAVMGLRPMDYAMESAWFNHACQVRTFYLEELLATKMRALYQRRKGRDLFDLWLGLTEGRADPAKVVSLFLHYMNASGHAITQKLFLKNLDEKMKHAAFAADLPQLLAPGVTFDWHVGFQEILNKLAVLLPETS
jgi:predicted nucleotidyltransferase component of viral defense system